MSAPHELPSFVLAVAAADRARYGTLDVYRSASPAGARRPVILFVHGGPLPPAVRPAPRDWPMFVGYACLAAEHQLIGALVEHRLHSPGDYPLAAGDIAAAVERVRELPDADPDRVALWFFSGGGLLAAEWLVAAPRPWLRCVALTYPVLAPMPGWDVDPRFRPTDVAADAGVPVVLTRVGRENPGVAAGVDAFITAAKTGDRQLEVIDVPDGQHSFDMLDHTDDSRAAVRQAMDRVVALLHG